MSILIIGNNDRTTKTLHQRDFFIEGPGSPTAVGLIFSSAIKNGFDASSEGIQQVGEYLFNP